MKKVQDPMADISTLIRSEHAAIVARWTAEAQKVASARGLDRPAFQNIMPLFISSLAGAGPELGHFSGARREYIESHLASRIIQGFGLAEIVEEIALIGPCIAQSWAGRPAEEQPSPADVAALHVELHHATSAVAELFTHHMLEDEQIDKRYARLLQAVASSSLREGTPSLSERMREVLELILEALDAQTAGLMLLDVETGTPEVVASTGPAGKNIESFAVSLSPSSFLGKAAAFEGSTAIDVNAAGLEVPELVKAGGIRSLLGVRIPPRHKLVGVVYVGRNTERRFASRDRLRLETLGEKLTLHLENATLYDNLRRTIDELREEREVRDRFVSILAHDLRGPLTAARIAARVLGAAPELSHARHMTTKKLETNLARTDAMIRDLLDANRVRAGQPLPLRIARCDLVVIVEEVLADLRLAFGDHFVLDVDGSHEGFWGADELRRAVWNLASNAIKYGAQDSTVTVHIASSASETRVAVHNEGAAIPTADMPHLFEPWARAPDREHAGERGWGLGLALVKACADAHGGSISVESTAAGGTTFTLKLPRDSRPLARSDAVVDDQPRPQ